MPGEQIQGAALIRQSLALALLMFGSIASAAVADATTLNVLFVMTEGLRPTRAEQLLRRQSA